MFSLVFSRFLVGLELINDDHAIMSSMRSSHDFLGNLSYKERVMPTIQMLVLSGHDECTH